MNPQYIIDRTRGIILSPVQEWETIKNEQKSNLELILTFALPLAVLGALARLVGLWGWNRYWGIGWSIRYAVLEALVPLAAIVIASYVLYALAGSFNSDKNLNNAFKLVTHAYTPALLAAVVANLSLYLSWIGLLGLYSIYLFWTGVPQMLHTPEQKKLGYVIVSAVVIILVNITVAAIVGTGSLVYGY